MRPGRISTSPAWTRADRAHALGPAGPTGFGVRLLDHLVAARFEEADHHAVP